MQICIVTRTNAFMMHVYMSRYIVTFGGIKTSQSENKAFSDARPGAYAGLQYTTWPRMSTTTRNKTVCVDLYSE